MKEPNFDSSIAWEMFKQSGSVGMYLFYKALKDDEMKLKSD